jgi:spore germination cell wall hydrolase CwlJ-like protein
LEFHDGVAARTIYGEARGESPQGRIAVAHVIRNRIHARHRGRTVAAVCLANKQFSCWNIADPNRRLLLDLDDDDSDLIASLIAWQMSATVPDPTHGALHYKVVGTKADWDTPEIEPSVVIGNHEFFVGIR